MARRWTGGDGDTYDEQWRRMAAAGQDVHGEASLVDELLGGPARAQAVLDAGCGTGRVAIELSRRGYETVGVDLDPAMLSTAREKAPALEWVEADLDGLDLGPQRRNAFAAVVAAGNVMIFVAPRSEARVVSSLARHLAPGGLLVAGFQLGPRRLALADYDGFARDAGLALEHRWATWGREPFDGGDYAVSVHRAG